MCDNQIDNEMSEPVKDGQLKKANPDNTKAVEVQTIETEGACDEWKLIAKAKFKGEKWQKQTWAYHVKDLGVLVAVATAFGNNIAESTAFIGGAGLAKDPDGTYRIVRCEGAILADQESLELLEGMSADQSFSIQRVSNPEADDKTCGCAKCLAIAAWEEAKDKANQQSEKQAMAMLIASHPKIAEALLQADQPVREGEMLTASEASIDEPPPLRMVPCNHDNYEALCPICQGEYEKKKELYRKIIRSTLFM